MRSVVCVLALAVLPSVVSAAPVYVRGWETYDAGPATTTGTLDYATTYKRSGNAGMQIAPTSASDYRDECYDLGASSGYLSRFYAKLASADTGSTTVARFEDSTNVVGCYLAINYSASGTSATVWYDGGLDEPIDFGTTDLPDGEWEDLTLVNKRLDADSVFCGLYSGQGVFRFGASQDVPIGFTVEQPQYLCFGTKAGLPAQASAIWVDDLVVDSLIAPGPGRIEVMHPDGDRTQSPDFTSVGSTCGSDPNPEGCVYDWSQGLPFDWDAIGGTGCVNPSNDGDSVRRRTSDVDARDTFTFSNPTLSLTGAEFLSGVVPVAVGCVDSDGQGPSPMALVYESTHVCTSDSQCNTGYAGYDCDTQGSAEGGGTYYCNYKTPFTDWPNGDTAIWDQAYWDTNPDTGVAWTTTEVDGFRGGYWKDNVGGKDGDVNVAAIMALVDIREPALLPDHNLIDFQPVGAPDGVIVSCTGGDSISAGTGASLCSEQSCKLPRFCSGGSADGDGCFDDGDCPGGSCGAVEFCSVDADCAHLQTPAADISAPACFDGFCQVQCGASSDCDLCGGACPASKLYVSRIASSVETIDTVWNCAWSGSTTEDMIEDHARFVVDPLHASSTTGGSPTLCSLIKGDAGRCSVTTATACSSDAACPVAEVCNAYPCDYVTAVGGINNSSGMTPTDGVHVFYDAPYRVNALAYGEKTMPLAAPTPGTYQCPRVSCTTDADCTGDPSLGVGSVCMYACAGRTDPVWPCTVDAHCGECANDAGRQCGAGVLGVTGIVCGPDPTTGLRVPCAAGTCSTTGTQYCTCPPQSVACSTDSDCKSEDASYLGGSCVDSVCAYTGVNRTGIIEKYVCHGGTSDGDACDLEADCPGGGTCRLDSALLGAYERRRAKLGHGSRDVLAGLVQMQTEAEAAGSRFIHFTNMSITPYNSAVTGGFFQGTPGTRINVREITNKQRRLRYVVDLLYPSRNRDDPNSIAAADGWWHGALRRDPWHPNELGSGVLANAAKGMFDNLVPVCDDDETVLCGYCDVACEVSTESTDCASGFCSGGKCRCTADAQCGDGTCEDIGGGVFKCVVPNIDQCPPGNNTESRWLRNEAGLCPSGNCLSQHSGARCVIDGRTNCIDDADCPGAGNRCALDGVHIECDHDGMCRTPGPFNADVCANDDATPIAGQGVGACRQPTRTP